MTIKTFLQKKINRYSADIPTDTDLLNNGITACNSDQGCLNFMAYFMDYYPEAQRYNEFADQGEPDPALFLQFMGITQTVIDIVTNGTFNSADIQQVNTTATNALGLAQLALDEIGDINGSFGNQTVTDVLLELEEALATNGSSTDPRIGLLSDLNTANKTKVVFAINEANSKAEDAETCCTTNSIDIIDLTARVSVTESVNEAQNGTLDDHEGRIVSLESSDVTQNSIITIHGLRLSALESSESAQNASISVLEGEVSNLMINVTDLASAIANINPNGGGGGNQTQIDALEVLVLAQGVEITDLQTSQSTQNTEISDITSRLTNLEVNGSAGTQMQIDEIETIIGNISDLALVGPDLVNISSSAILGLHSTSVILDSVLAATNLLINISNIYSQNISDLGSAVVDIQQNAGNQTEINARLDMLESVNEIQNGSIAELQDSDAGQNIGISNLQNSDALQSTAIGDLQSSDAVQNSSIADLQSSDAAQNATQLDIITALLAESIVVAALTNSTNSNLQDLSDLIATVSDINTTLSDEIADLHLSDAAHVVRLNDAEAAIGNISELSLVGSSLVDVALSTITAIQAGDFITDLLVTNTNQLINTTDIHTQNITDLANSLANISEISQSGISTLNTTIGELSNVPFTVTSIVDAISQLFIAVQASGLSLNAVISFMGNLSNLNPNITGTNLVEMLNENQEHHELIDETLLGMSEILANLTA